MLESPAAARRAPQPDPLVGDFTVFRLSEPTARTETACSMRDALATAGLLAASVAVTFDAWRDIVRVAVMDEELSYVLLAPLVIVCLAWSRRRKLRDCPIAGNWSGVVLMAIGWAVYWYGYRFDPVLWRAGAVALAGASIVAGLGTAVARRMAPALAAMVFLIPIDPTGRYHIAGPLEVFTARATQTVCDLIGLYVQRDGNLLLINGTAVTVAEACNGARMVLALFMVCYFVAFATPAAWYARAVLLLASPLVAIAANVLRLVPTIWVFSRFSHPIAERFHSAAGYVMLVVSFLLLMAIFRPMQKRASLPAGSTI
jgi:exosortase